jgi:hypothetical protein
MTRAATPPRAQTLQRSAVVDAIAYPLARAPWAWCVSPLRRAGHRPLPTQRGPKNQPVTIRVHHNISTTNFML